MIEIKIIIKAITSNHNKIIGISQVAISFNLQIVN